MKTVKVMEKFAKQAYEDMRTGTKKAMAFCMGDGNLAVLVDGFMAWLVPENVFPFDMAIVGESKERADIIKGMFEKANSGTLAETVEEVEASKGTKALKLVSGDKVVWINKDFLKTFDKKVNLYISDFKSPVLVCEEDGTCNGEAAGIILPIRPLTTNGLTD